MTNNELQTIQAIALATTTVLDMVLRLHEAGDGAPTIAEVKEANERLKRLAFPGENQEGVQE